ncbi:MAG: hypothetical protein HY423_07985 [Candidatus Lambdaproteobacteria bacterium]|nr:hypothetical protein [Candidatus Lambdaproteobacteria bacterium]
MGAGDKPEPRAGNAPGRRDEGWIEALLDERLSAAGRREMARQVADHDRSRTPAGFDPAAVRRRLRFHGELPEKLRGVLQAWVPELMAHAARQGLRLREPFPDIAVYSAPAYVAKMGAAIPAQLRLPASSYTHEPRGRLYTVSLVLPERSADADTLVTALRALATRLLGDIYLREDVLTQEAYREELRPPEAATAAPEEMLRLLAALPKLPPALERALALHGKAIGLDARRAPQAVRKAFFEGLRKELESRRLTPERAALVESAYGAHVQALRADPARALAATIAQVEALDGQLHFLPPDEAPQYRLLREKNPEHFLRSAQLRLDFLVELLAALLEDVSTLEAPQAPVSPLLEERIASQMEELRAQKLVRPYLIEDARLGEELRARRDAFPLEVHALLSRMPPAADPRRAFDALSRRLRSNIYQRLYTMLLLLQAWVKARERQQDDPFRAGERYRQLTALLANFRLRKPLLEALRLQAALVLECVEAARSSKEAARRLPVEPFARAWSLFVAPALVAGYLGEAGAGRLPGFSAPRYLDAFDAGLRRQIGASPGPADLAYLLRRFQHHAGAEALPALAGLLRAPSRTFRFVARQALLQPGRSEQGAEARLDQLDGWAQLVWQALQASRRNAITVGAGAALPTPGRETGRG